MNGPVARGAAFERAFDPGRVSALRLLVCAGLVLTLGALLARRAAELQGEIERLAVRQTAEALRMAVDAEVIVREVRGESEALRRLVGANPMRLLRPPPANYLGESTERAPREKPGSWHFDPVKRELVYLTREHRPGRGDAGAGARIRFKIAASTTESTRDPHAASTGVPRLVAIEAPAWLEGSSAPASRTR